MIVCLCYFCRPLENGWVKLFDLFFSFSKVLKNRMINA